MRKCINIGPLHPPKCIQTINTTIIPIGSKRCPQYYIKESPFPDCCDDYYDCYDDNCCDCYEDYYDCGYYDYCYPPRVAPCPPTPCIQYPCVRPYFPQPCKRRCGYY